MHRIRIRKKTQIGRFIIGKKEPSERVRALLKFESHILLPTRMELQGNVDW